MSSFPVPLVKDGQKAKVGFISQVPQSSSSSLLSVCLPLRRRRRRMRQGRYTQAHTLQSEWGQQKIWGKHNGEYLTKMRQDLIVMWLHCLCVAPLKSTFRSLFLTRAKYRWSVYLYMYVDCTVSCNHPAWEDSDANVHISSLLILRNHHRHHPPSPGQAVIFPFDWNIGSSSFTLCSTVATVTVCCDSVRFVMAKCAFSAWPEMYSLCAQLQMEDYKCWLDRKN